MEKLECVLNFRKKTRETDKLTCLSEKRKAKAKSISKPPEMKAQNLKSKSAKNTTRSKNVPRKGWSSQSASVGMVLLRLLLGTWIWGGGYRNGLC
ncbi:hypothetical protein AVEN_3362-1 [Araneus ventricosus]|uniref:Uncharacterized protein n=1 Tax=Araneus ventricosus TaxID=182803 RepID=A0A4Y2FMY7_ARAVE|nr:hypothetical protein AVEN_3362-1 [Araneus ventricosus]